MASTTDDWSTGIAEVRDDDVLIRGELLSNMIGERSFGELAFLVVSGRWPTEGEAHVLEPCHGVRVGREHDRHAGLDREPDVGRGEVEPRRQAVHLERHADLQRDADHRLEVERVRWPMVEDAPLRMGKAADGGVPHRLDDLGGERSTGLALSRVKAELQYAFRYRDEPRWRGSAPPRRRAQVAICPVMETHGLHLPLASHQPESSRILV